jgi:hypothetical protein
MDRSFVPSIVPSGYDQTVYLVINNFGNLGTAFPETDIDKADLETLIGDLMSGQYSDPVRVVAFNTAEHWAEDASEDVAREIMRRLDLSGHELPSSIQAFVDSPSRSRQATDPAVGVSRCRGIAGLPIPSNYRART